eukprot:3173290-Rhodomonas_salina.1
MMLTSSPPLLSHLIPPSLLLPFHPLRHSPSGSLPCRRDPLSSTPFPPFRRFPSLPRQRNPPSPTPFHPLCTLPPLSTLAKPRSKGSGP